MKNTDLRIGNWVDTVYNVPYIKITEIKESVIYGKNCKGMDYGSLKPIPLTEEILLKCGFEKEGDYGYIFFGEITNYILDEDIAGTYQVGVNHGSCTNFFSWDIKYLHQLQNLFYAINGKELEIMP